MEEVNEVGTENIKKVVTNVIDVVLEYQKAKADDGKVTKMELIGFADEAIALSKNLLAFNKLKEEVMDINLAEGQDLVQYVVDQGVLPEKAQIVVVHAFAATEKLIGVYVDDIVPIIEVFKKD